MQRETMGGDSAQLPDPNAFSQAMSSYANMNMHYSASNAGSIQHTQPSHDPTQPDMPQGMHMQNSNTASFQAPMINSMNTVTCLVCYNAQVNIMLEPCHHQFHVHCIDRWLNKDKVCPVCWIPIQSHRAIGNPYVSAQTAPTQPTVQRGGQQSTYQSPTQADPVSPHAVGSTTSMLSGPANSILPAQAAANMEHPNPPSMRKGKWTAEESGYCDRLIEEFKKGNLPLAEGTTLRTFLSKLLNCDPMRISKKYTGDQCIGKIIFRRREDELSKEEMESIRHDLAELEKTYLEREQYNQRRREKRMESEISRDKSRYLAAARSASTYDPSTTAAAVAAAVSSMRPPQQPAQQTSSQQQQQQQQRPPAPVVAAAPVPVSLSYSQSQQSASIAMTTTPAMMTQSQASSAVSQQQQQQQQLQLQQHQNAMYQQHLQSRQAQLTLQQQQQLLAQHAQAQAQARAHAQAQVQTLQPPPRHPVAPHHADQQSSMATGMQSHSYVNAATNRLVPNGIVPTTHHTSQTSVMSGVADATTSRMTSSTSTTDLNVDSLTRVSSIDSFGCLFPRVASIDGFGSSTNLASFGQSESLDPTSGGGMVKSISIGDGLSAFFPRIQSLEQLSNLLQEHGPTSSPKANSLNTLTVTRPPPTTIDSTVKVEQQQNGGRTNELDSRENAMKGEAHRDADASQRLSPNGSNGMHKSVTDHGNNQIQAPKPLNKMPRNSSGIFPRVPSMDKLPRVPSMDKLPRIPSMDKLSSLDKSKLPRVPSLDRLSRVPSTSDMLSRFGDQLSSFPSFSNLSGLSTCASFDKLSALGANGGAAGAFRPGFPRNSSIEDILSLVASSESGGLNSNASNLQLSALATLAGEESAANNRKRRLADSGNPSTDGPMVSDAALQAEFKKGKVAL